MSTKHLPYITLDSVVTDYLTESDGSNHRYFKAWQIAYRGMENLGLDFFYRVPTVKLPVLANFTVKLPAGFMQWCKVGVENNHGGIITLKENPNLNLYADLLPDRIEKVNDPESSWATWNANYYTNYWNGTGYSNIYGVPSGEPFVGEFKVDIENGVIVLNDRFRYPYIILQYVASPEPGAECYLPVQFREALIAWIWWKDKKTINVKRGAVGISRDLKSDFYRERRNAIAQWKPSRLSEKYQSSQELTRLAVKT